MRNCRLQSIEAVVQWQQRVAPEGDNDGFVLRAENGRARLPRSGLAILDCLPLPPLGDRLRVDPKLTAQLRGRSLRSLYCCSDGVRGRGAAMTYLSHKASFHSIEWIAPSNPGIKQLGFACSVRYCCSRNPAISSRAMKPRDGCEEIVERQIPLVIRPREPFRRHTVHIRAARHIHLVAAGDVTTGIDNLGIHGETSDTGGREPLSRPPNPS